MTSLMHLEEKVHRKGLVRADSLPLLMPRLLYRFSSTWDSRRSPGRDEDAVPSGYVTGAGDGHAPIFYPSAAGQEEVPAPEPEVERSPAPPVSLHLLLYILHQQPQQIHLVHPTQHTIPPEYVHASSREITGVMDAICSLAAHLGSPGSEVGSVSLHAGADYDSPGSSSCSRSEGGAYSSSIRSIGCFGSSSSCYRPTTTTAVRWLDSFTFLYSYQLYQLPTNFD